MKETEFHTHLYGLILVYKPNRLNKIGFRFRTPQGKQTTHWVDIPPNVFNKFNKLATQHIQMLEARSKLTHEQIMKLFEEQCGS
jgi:hypothetical protein